MLYIILVNHDRVYYSEHVFSISPIHSAKPELRFCTDSNFAHGVSEIRDGEDL